MPCMCHPGLHTLPSPSPAPLPLPPTRPPAGSARTPPPWPSHAPARRFRPPSVMGDSKYEHTQNVTLQRILNACLAMQSSQATLQAQQGEGPGGGT